MSAPRASCGRRTRRMRWIAISEVAVDHNRWVSPHGSALDPLSGPASSYCSSVSGHMSRSPPHGRLRQPVAGDGCQVALVRVHGECFGCSHHSFSSSASVPSLRTSRSSTSKKGQSAIFSPLLASRTARATQPLPSNEPSSSSRRAAHERSSTGHPGCSTEGFSPQPVSQNQRTVGEAERKRAPHHEPRPSVQLAGKGRPNDSPDR